MVHVEAAAIGVAVFSLSVVAATKITNIPYSHV
jgi:hypothetical protein